MLYLLMILAACGTSEVTAGPEDSQSDAADTAPTDTGTSSDPDPGRNGNVFILIEMGRAEPSIAFWYGYCADRDAADCPEWSNAGTVVNQPTFRFDYVAIDGAIKFDGLIDTDGDGESDKEVADADAEGACYRTGGVTAELDGRSVSDLVEMVGSEDLGCILGLSVTDAWNAVYGP